MHEVGICEGIVAAVLARAAGREVSRVRVRAGVQQRIVPESMQQAFRMVAAGTVAADAAVDLEIVPVTLTCIACGFAGDANDPYATCSRCGSVDVEAWGGDELILVSVSLRSTASPPR